MARYRCFRPCLRQGLSDSSLPRNIIVIFAGILNRRTAANSRKFQIADEPLHAFINFALQYVQLVHSSFREAALAGRQKETPRPPVSEHCKLNPFHECIFKKLALWTIALIQLLLYFHKNLGFRARGRIEQYQPCASQGGIRVSQCPYRIWSHPEAASTRITAPILTSASD